MELVDRLYRRLAIAAMEGAESAADQVTTIAAIYQRLIPYRAVRGEIGVMELAEYEHALLRLLSGERGYLQVLDRAALVEIQRELASISPILGIYRDYPNVEVRITAGGTEAAIAASGRPAAVDEPSATGEGPTGGGMAPEIGTRRASQPPAVTAVSGEMGTETAALLSGGEADAASAEAAPGEGRDGDRKRIRIAGGRVPHRTSTEPPPTRASESAGEITAAAGDVRETARSSIGDLPRNCRACSKGLPPIDDLNYCPFCGSEQRPPACASCGTILRGDWRFCTRCGTERPGPTTLD